MSFFRYFYSFFEDIYANRFVLFQLTKRDYKNRYMGSLLGFFWTIVQPIITILVLWVVFVWGFKNAPVQGNIPFIVWLLVGMVPWTFFSELLSTSTNVFLDYGYLVKQINFRISILPLVKVFSSLIIHFVLLFIMLIVISLYGFPFSIYWLQSFYYLFAMTVFLTSLSWITASLLVFYRDIGQVISIVLQFLFWLTPILWDYHNIPEKYFYILRLNPLFYIIEGYRKSFIYHEPLWNDPKTTLFFWAITFVTLVIGVFLFKRLKPHFADVL